MTDTQELVKRLLALADGKWEPADKPFNHDEYCSLVHAERNKAMREAALALQQERERCAIVAAEYAAEMWGVAESRRDQGMFDAAYQHEAAKEACNVVAGLIRALPPQKEPQR